MTESQQATPSSSPAQEARSSRWLPWLLSLGLVVLVGCCYLLNGKALMGGDTVPHRYLPLSILCEGNFDLNEIPLGKMKPNGTLERPYYLTPGQKGRMYSVFGVTPSIMAMPVFAWAALQSKHFSYERILMLGKYAASLMMMLAVFLLFWAFATDIPPWGALVLALAWGLGTSAWSMMSQAIWQHTGAAPWLAGALLCLLRGRTSANWLPWAGLCLGCATLCRNSNLLIALPFTAYVWLHHRKQFWQFAFLASLPAFALFYYNYQAFGHPLKFGQLLVGSQLAKWKTGVASSFTTDPLRALVGFAGILVSPSRGIFVYSPVLLFGAVGLGASWRKGGDPLFRWASIGYLGVIVLHSFWFDWWGGWTYGYRLPFDCVILLTLGIVPLWQNIQKIQWRKWGFVAALVGSIVFQGLGAFAYDVASWNGQPNVDRHPQRLWSITDSQLLYYLQRPGWRFNKQRQDCPRWSISICPPKAYRPVHRR